MWPCGLNPIGLVVGAIAAIIALGVAVYEVIKHWQGLKKFFSGFWDFVTKGFSAAVSWVTGLWQGIVKVFEKITGWLGLGDKKVEVKASKDINNNVTLTTSSSPPTSGNTSRGNAQQVVYNNTFNISAGNMSPEALANYIIKKIHSQHTTSMAH